ncbi:MAG: DUF3990 domain-containing protein [Bacteroidales bacterium]|nr:DUF3990 domain-containing protein [Bacteroidales bacterium]
MIVYHASPFIIEKPDVNHSRENLDFGKGFYLTTLHDQAVKYAQRFKLRGKEAFVNKYELCDDFNSLEVKRFLSYDEEWLDFVSACRRNADSSTFDIVIGGIANDKVFRTIDLYFSGDMNKDEALQKLKFEQPNNQLCIRSQNAINKCLKFLDAEGI